MMSSRAPVLGVSACLFQAGRVLLVERARPPFEGLLSLPGGRVAFGERLLEAAMRELGEEVGLRDASLVFHAMHEAIDRDGGIHAVIAVFRGAADLPASFVPQAGDDAGRCVFVEMADLVAIEADGLTTAGLSSVVAAACETPITAS